MNSTAHLSLRDYWDIAVRRKWLILGILVVSLTVSAVLGVYLPRIYRSSTLILVETQKIPEHYVSSVVGGSVSERLTSIQQQVLSRTLLHRVIEEFALYPESMRTGALETVVEGMRKNIKIETRAGGGRVEAFSISFAHEEPVTAMKVTARLASQFIEENLKAREQFVEGTTEFLDQELKRAKASLEEQEQAISDFKRSHTGELPGQMDANLHALDRLQRETTTVTESLENATDRRNAIQKAMQIYETMGMPMVEAPRRTQFTPADGERSVRRQDDHEGMIPGFGSIDPMATRLRELERVLASLKSEYKETYPDVIQVKHEIEQLKARLAEKYGNVKQEKPDTGPVKTAAERRQPTLRYDAYYQELITQREEAEASVDTLKDRQRRLIAQIKEYDAKVGRAPQREQEMMILLRDYENTKRNYEHLLDKQLNARVSENLEKRQKGETFRILDPAHLPEKPEKPDRAMIMLIGLALGCGLGYGAAFALEQMSESFRRPEEVESVLGLPVLATIPSLQVAYKDAASRTALPLSRQFANLANGGSYGQGASQGYGEKPKSGKDRQTKRSWLPWRRAGAKGKEAVAAKPVVGFPLELNLVARWRPSSVVSEQFRVAATRLVLMSRERKNTVVVVTSALKGEGKSTTASNLGYVLARDLGKSTLIIDCDLKRPVLHAYTSVPQEPGLAEVLHGEQHIETCIRGLGELPLWILPSGGVVEKPVELGRVHMLADLLLQLRSRFEYIILDAPPILPLADMNVLASMADVMTLVIRAEVTRRDTVQRALANLRVTSQIGIVLTGLWSNQMPYYMQEYYYAQSRTGQAV